MWHLPVHPAVMFVPSGIGPVRLCLNLPETSSSRTMAVPAMRALRKIRNIQRSKNMRRCLRTGLGLWILPSFILLGLASSGCKIINEQQAPQQGRDEPVYRRDDDRTVYRRDDGYPPSGNYPPQDNYPRGDYPPNGNYPPPDPYRRDADVRHVHDSQWNDDRARDPELDDSWTFLGRRVVDFRGNHDTFKVGRSFGRFRVLKFVIRNGDLDIFNMLIIVGDGDKVRPDLRQHYGENTASRSIDLPGDQRTVQKVDFEYRSTSRKDGRAIVALYGK
jgi:hypothetical protein